MKRTIFISIDGVLRPIKDNELNLSSKALTLLKAFLDETKAFPVFCFDKIIPEYANIETFGVLLKEIFEKYDFNKSTCDYLVFSGKNKKKELQNYIKAHPDIEYCSYVSSDDYLIGTYMVENWVYVDHEYGLQEKHINEIRAAMEYEVDRDFEFLDLLYSVITSDMPPELSSMAKEITRKQIENAQTENERNIYIKQLQELENR